MADYVKNQMRYGTNWKNFINKCLTGTAISDGMPAVYGTDDRVIEASAEPSGLQLYAKLSDEEWNRWFELFKQKATAALGYPVGEPEDGFEFPLVP